MSGSYTQVWRIENDVATCMGIVNPENGVGTYFKANSGETIWDALRRMTPWFEPDGQCPFHRTVLGPGEFYPRIARPDDQHPGEAPGWNPGGRTETNVMAIACGQLATLTRQPDRICQTVHPTEKNLRGIRPRHSEPADPRLHGGRKSLARRAC